MAAAADLLLAGVCRGFDQFDTGTNRRSRGPRTRSLAGGGERLLVPAESVVEHGGGESGHAEHSAFAPGGSVRGGCLDQVDRVGGASPATQPEFSEWYRSGA